MKYLYQELQQFETNLSYAFEDEERRAELDEMTENIYFEDGIFFYNISYLGLHILWSLFHRHGCISRVHARCTNSYHTRHSVAYSVHVYYSIGIRLT